MSSSRRALFSIALLVIPSIIPVSAVAQDARAATIADQQRGEVRDALAEPDCERDEFQRDTIIVCGRAEAEAATRAVMSPLPAPVQSDRNLMGGLRDQPCWVTRVPGVVCMRGGFAPPPVVLIDLDKFPDALSAEEAAHVFAVEANDPQQ